MPENGASLKILLLVVNSVVIVFNVCSVAFGFSHIFYSHDLSHSFSHFLPNLLLVSLSFKLSFELPFSLSFTLSFSLSF